MIPIPERVHALVELYASKHSDRFGLDAKVHQRLLRLCELAEILSDEFYAESTDIQISPGEKCGTIHLNVGELVFEHGRSHPFFDLTKNADFFTFSNAEDGLLQVTFGVQDLWVAK